MPAATKKKPAPPAAAIHAVVGTDESEVKKCALELAARLTPADAGEFGKDIIDGCVETADQAASRIHQTVEALLTLPFFGGGKFVWLKNVNFLGDNVLGRSAAVLEALDALGDVVKAGLPGNVAFLLSATEVDKRRAFYKSLSAVASVQVLDKLDATRPGWEEEAASAVQARAKEIGLTFEPEAIELFALSTGGESRQIGNELEKLDLYLGARRRISAEDVRLLVPLSRAGVIFELGNALAERNIPQCLALIDRLLFQGESAIGILLVAIVPTVRNLLLVKDLMERHRLPPPQAPFHFTSTLNRLPEAAVAHLPRRKDGSLNGYGLGVVACHANRFRQDELRGLFYACLNANVQLVTSQLDARMVLDQLVGRLAEG